MLRRAFLALTLPSRSGMAPANSVLDVTGRMVRGRTVSAACCPPRYCWRRWCQT